MEGEWRLGCPVEHHKQGVHSNSKELNRVPKRNRNTLKKNNKVSKDPQGRIMKERNIRLGNKILIF